MFCQKEASDQSFYERSPLMKEGSEMKNITKKQTKKGKVEKRQSVGYAFIGPAGFCHGRHDHLPDGIRTVYQFL